jgi:CRISPR-associated protein Cas5d
VISASVRIRVSGDLACFTRPETKVERYSYPVMTPSAARNILDAICWRPQMRWIVTSITVLKPIRYISILRNEVQSKASPRSMKQWAADPSAYKPLVAGAGIDTDGTPRNSTLLRDVAYVIEAVPRVFDASGDNTPAKYVAMMQRRVEKGQCFQRPFLGCREFAAEFSPPKDDEAPIPVSMDIGRMLYDIAFLPEGNRATFFHAQLMSGVMDTRPEVVLSEESRCDELLRCSWKPPGEPVSECREEEDPCSSRR